jgi:hypothetical protein
MLFYPTFCQLTKTHQRRNVFFSEAYGGGIGYPQLEGGLVVEILQGIPDELPVLQINTIVVVLDELTLA